MLIFNHFQHILLLILQFMELQTILIIMIEYAMVTEVEEASGKVMDGVGLDIPVSKGA